MSKKIHIPDEGLRRALDYNKIDVVDGKVEIKELQKITSIDWSSDGIGEHDPDLFEMIRSLEGLEHALNIKDISFTGNGLKNLDALANMNKLEAVWVRNNSITDISSLKDKHSLKTLVLSDNRELTDIIALAGLSNLENISLSGTKIKDLSVLKTLPNIRKINLSSFEIEQGSKQWKILLDLAKNNVQITIDQIYRKQFERDLAKRKMGNTSTKENHDELFELLIKLELTDIALLWQKDGIKATDKDGNPIMHLILMTELKEEIKKLLQLCLNFGCDINEYNRQNDHATPLTTAIKNFKDLSIIDFLLEHGARTDIPKGKPPMWEAIDGVNRYPEGSMQKKLSQKYFERLLEIDVDIATPPVFIQLCQHGKLEYVEKAIQDGADVNCEFDNNTPLTKAVRNNQIEIAKILLKKSADPNLPDGYSISPMFYVKSIKMYELLIDAGWNSTICSFEGNTPLFEIAKWGTECDENLPIAIEIIDRLVDRGASVNSRNANNETILYTISDKTNGAIHIIEKLIAYGANINAANRGCTPFDNASSDKVKAAIKKLGGVQFATYIKQLLKIITSDIQPKTPEWHSLIELVELGKATEIPEEVKAHIAKLLISDKTPIAKLLEKIDPLHKAVLVYLNQGVHGRDDQGNTLIHIIFEGENYENYMNQKKEAIIEQLVKNGVDITLLNCNNESALYTYLNRGTNHNLSVVKMLTNKKTVNPAVNKGNPIIASANKRANNETYGEPNEAMDKILDYLVDQGANLALHNVLISLCRSGRVDLVKKSIEAGADPNIESYNETTGLEVAVESNQIETIEYLLKEVDIHPDIGYDVKDESPLHKVQSLKALNLLLKYGADINLKEGYNNRKVISRVAELRFIDINEQLAMIETLIKSGADIYERDGSGKSAYDLLCERNEPEVQSFVKKLEKQANNS